MSRSIHVLDSFDYTIGRLGLFVVWLPRDRRLSADRVETRNAPSNVVAFTASKVALMDGGVVERTTGKNRPYSSALGKWCVTNGVSNAVLASKLPYGHCTFSPMVAAIRRLHAFPRSNQRAASPIGGRV